MKYLSSKETLHFNVTGEFVTNTARRWYWQEERGLDIVLKFLKSCMGGTDQSDEELEKLAIGVLLGEYKFIGSTSDNSYALTDDEDLNTKDSMKCFVKKEYGVYNSVFNTTYDALKNKANKNEYQEPIRDMNDMELGWLSPTGVFHPVPWGEHEKWACDYVDKHYSLDNLGINAFRDLHKDKNGNLIIGSDVLREKLHWILIHNPSTVKNNECVEINEMNIISKAQKEFLYDYFTHRNNSEQAEKYLNY